MTSSGPISALRRLDNRFARGPAASIARRMALGFGRRTRRNGRSQSRCSRSTTLRFTRCPYVSRSSAVARRYPYSGCASAIAFSGASRCAYFCAYVTRVRVW